MVNWITNLDTWISLGTLSLLEIVLGIDNIVFLSMVIDKLPFSQQNSARNLGLFSAMIIRLGLISIMAWVSYLAKPIFYIYHYAITIRNLILWFGGIFLIWKSCQEILDLFHKKDSIKKNTSLSYSLALLQIMMLDIIFSLDSVITAIGLASHLCIMITAVIFSVIIMIFLAKLIGEFVKNNTSVKILALAFLILIGGTLILTSIGINIPKGYIYFAMFFSFLVEMLNISLNKKLNK